MSLLRQRGVTLVEMAVAVAVIGFVASVAVLNTGVSDVARVEAAQSLVARAVRFARDEALRTRQPYGVALTDGARQIRVFRVDPGVDASVAIFDVRDPLSNNLWDQRFDDDPVTAGVTLTIAGTWRGTCGNNRRIVFRDAATPGCLSTPGTLLDSATVTLALGGHEATVFIEGFVARVDLN